jgi:hypothetical protein
MPATGSMPGPANRDAVHAELCRSLGHDWICCVRRRRRMRRNRVANHHDRIAPNLKFRGFRAKLDAAGEVYRNASDTRHSDFSDHSNS